MAGEPRRAFASVGLPRVLAGRSPWGFVGWAPVHVMQAFR